jgi:predicted 3-demethylubiquinone-9 3-methyltransferase (glyoxalase superfamily)
MKLKQKITPFLSYPHQAEEAARFYVTLLPDSKINRIVRNPANDSVMTVEFELSGMAFIALNVGQPWEFTNAFSLSVSCDSQEEIDTLWGKLVEGGNAIQCGWLTDKYGMAWQIVPAQVSQWLASEDTDKIGRFMGAMMQMTKLDVRALQEAFDGV